VACEIIQQEAGKGTASWRRLAQRRSRTPVTQRND
jgi:hypothetical protein